MLIDLSKNYPKGIWKISNGGGVCLIVATKNIVSYLLSLVYNIDVGDRNIDPLFIKDLRESKLTLSLLEECNEGRQMGVRLGWWLRNTSESKYVHQKKGGDLKAIVKMVRVEYVPKFGVFLSGTSNTTMVALFDSKLEAEDWKDEHYKEEWVERIIMF